MISMPPQKILCPIDFSEASLEALRQAVNLAGRGCAELCVLHVERAPQTEALRNSLGQEARLGQGVYKEANHRAESVKSLHAVMDERVPPRVRAWPLLKQGEPAAEIVRTAHEEGTDVIVLAICSTGGAHCGELDPVALRVLETAPCPVLTINFLTRVGALMSPKS